MEDSAIDISSVMPQKVKGKKKKKSGGFQSMNLSHPILRAILKKGYQVPTPIQRKAIPVVMEGKNVIAMARTGSGKTAAFLVPMLEKLKRRTPKSGARALIFSPTRELAMQTLKFTKELACHTDLKATAVLGGEKIENQFAAIHESPDVIIATPGRFLHVIVEMDLKLSSVEYVVFDEADRLFEMGFQEQLQEVLHRLPSERQALLFSATLPKVMVDFVKAGIDDPVLIRLDVDLQISENLTSSFLICRADDKTPTILYLLKHVVNLQKELTVIFLPTKHHIEYLRDVLEKANISCSYIYSSLDQVARTIHIAKFRAKKVCVMLVTDIAARGIDIPLLDNVINFNFPVKPKLYVHRVGRVARAGRTGRAISLVSSDEIPYLLDLHLFLGKPINLAGKTSVDEDGVCGSVPQSIIDDEMDALQAWQKQFVDIANMVKVIKNAQNKYVSSRPAPSSESIRRVKQMSFTNSEAHPMFKGVSETEQSAFIAEMKNFRPNSTIFELGALAKTSASSVMRRKRVMHAKFVKPVSDIISKKEPAKVTTSNLVAADENDLMGLSKYVDTHTFSKENTQSYKDKEHYLSYVSSEHYKDKGLGLESSFANQAAGAQLDFTLDDMDEAAKQKAFHSHHWDRKKKRFVGNDHPNAKKMKTESGVWIPKSYKSDMYKKWQEKNKVKYQEQDDSDNEESNHFGKKRKFPTDMKNTNKNKKGKMNRPPRRELKNKEEILKARNRKQRLMDHGKKKHNLKGKSKFRK